jgi:succinate dehydrogenase / fumarate reductase flavoprotein subunit
MLESIKNVEDTREFRKTQELGLLSPDDKANLLHNFHPDYKKGTIRKLRVGPSKNSKVVNEVAEIIEAYSPLFFDEGEPDLEKPEYDVDVLVIGAGGAGSSAALLAHEKGAEVLLVTKLRIGDANTMMAQGGIQAADKENDSPPIHYLDAMGGGGYHNDPELVEALVKDAPLVIEWLEELGTMFDKEADGTMITIHGGGTSRMRMHSARDYSGGEIMKTLRDEVRNRRIEVLEFATVVELLTDGKGTCTGAVVQNMETGKYTVVRAKTVVIATGGAGRLHVQGFPTTNHYGATADGLVIGYRVGVPLLFMDTIQYHPTGAAFPEQILGLLITEKVRGLGAHLCNREGNRFIYELETRDCEAAAIIRECTKEQKGVATPTGMVGVWLDSPLIEEIHGEGTIEKKLPAMLRQFERFEIDMRRYPILVYPTQHYQNGGLQVNPRCETPVKNLFAAGEVTGGVHGRNRLMGNSLLDVCVFGRRAGIYAAEAARKVKPGTLTLDHLKSYHEELQAAKVETEKRSPMVLPDYLGQLR